MAAQHGTQTPIAALDIVWIDSTIAADLKNARGLRNGSEEVFI